YLNLPVQLTNVFGNINCAGVLPLTSEIVFSDA
ncbi:unnamed protein product, partial [Rotaria sp. Silwood1]